jgi:calcineurin-like phosphoesterase family protein
MNKERQKIWFTSDLHFLHGNSIVFHPERLEAAGMSYSDFEVDRGLSMEQYAEWLIGKWNETVKREDSVYILGDFSLANRERTEKVLRRLRGKKYLIFGNHDKACKGLENYFEWCGDIKEAKFTENQFKFIDPNETFCVELCHYPLLTWNRRTHGSCHLHGHVHGALDTYNENSKELRLDVGWDGALAKKYGGLIELEDIYNEFRAKLDKAGASTFQEYMDKLMIEQGYRI